MVNSSTKDALERLNNWLNVLEKRIHALLDTNDPELMSPAQREQAAIRYLTVMLHFLQLLKEYPEPGIAKDDPAYVRALMDVDESDIENETVIQNLAQTYKAKGWRMRLTNSE